MISLSYDVIKKYEPLWGNWFFGELLGKGSIGEVYKISKKDHDREYISAVKVIKIPTDDQLKNFLSINNTFEEASIETYYKDIVKSVINEIDLLYKLKGNTNIITYEDHIIKKQADDKNSCYIFIRMEYVKSLKEHISNNKLLENDVIKMGIDICNALMLCHEKGILHRDVKESNIFINNDGNYKLGDFSVSKELHENNFAETRVGTINYMPPEIFKGIQYTKNADLYSLGLVMYKLLNNGRLPFMPYGNISSKDMESSYIKRIQGEPFNKPISGSNELISIILKSCSYGMDKRYQSAKDMKLDLEKIIKKLPNKNLEYSNNFEEITTKTSVNNNEYLTFTKNATSTIALFNDNDDKKKIENSINKKNNFFNYKKVLTLLAILILTSTISIFIYNQITTKNTNKKISNKSVTGKKVLKPNISLNPITDTSIPVEKTTTAPSPSQSQLLQTSLTPSVGPSTTKTVTTSSTPASTVIDKNVYNGHRYEVFDIDIAWSAAKLACQEKGGHLATITSQGEQDFVFTLAQRATNCYYWLGATDESSEDTWKWVTGETFSYSNWDIKQPDSCDGENYLHLVAKSNDWNLNISKWNDANSILYGQKKGYICEWESK